MEFEEVVSEGLCAILFGAIDKDPIAIESRCTLAEKEAVWRSKQENFPFRSSFRVSGPKRAHENSWINTQLFNSSILYKFEWKSHTLFMAATVGTTVFAYELSSHVLFIRRDFSFHYHRFLFCFPYHLGKIIIHSSLKTRLSIQNKSTNTEHKGKTVQQLNVSIYYFNLT